MVKNPEQDKGTQMIKYSKKSIALMVSAVALVGILLVISQKNNSDTNNRSDKNAWSEAIIDEPRSDTETSIEKYKLLGFTLGATYQGKIIDIPKAIIPDHNREYEGVAGDYNKDALFIRTKAPSNLGRLVLLISPKNHTILGVALVNPQANVEVLSTFLSSALTNCPDIDISYYITKIKNKEEFEDRPKDFEKCGMTVQAKAFIPNQNTSSRKFIFYMHVGMGPIPNDGPLPRKYPPTLKIELIDNELAVGFAPYAANISHVVNGNEYYHSAFYNLTGKKAREVINDDLKESAATGDSEALMALVKNEQDFDKKVEMLKPIEEQNSKAKLLLAEIFKKRATEISVTGATSDSNALDLEAFKRATALSNKGDLEGKALLASLYAQGRGVTRNLKTAANLYKESNSEVELTGFCRSNYKYTRDNPLSECASVDAKMKLEQEFRDKPKTVFVLASCSFMGAQNMTARDMAKSIAVVAANPSRSVASWSTLATTNYREYCSVMSGEETLKVGDAEIIGRDVKDPDFATFVMNISTQGPRTTYIAFRAKECKGVNYSGGACSIK